MAKAIDSDLLDILSRVECDGNAAKILERLDPKTYKRVNAVLTALGGAWNRKAQAHLFESFDSDSGASAATIIGDAVSAGEYLDPKQEYQFFETPPNVVEVMIAKAVISRSMSVLEPSAGRGVLARAARAAGGYVEFCEINPKMAALLVADDFAQLGEDFLKVQIPPPGYMKEAGQAKRLMDERFERIVMNPPFTRSQDIAHVSHAFNMLKPGGRLVAIMATGWTFRQDARAKAFRDLTNSYAADVEQLPAGSFKSSGTGVQTVCVTLNKPF